MHSKYWETRVELFHLRSENENSHSKISIVGVILGFEDFIVIAMVVVIVEQFIRSFIFIVISRIMGTPQVFNLLSTSSFQIPCQSDIETLAQVK
jgi:hypothetical protein